MDLSTNLQEEKKKVYSIYLTNTVFRKFKIFCVELGKNHNDGLEELLISYKNAGNPYDTISMPYERTSK